MLSPEEKKERRKKIIRFTGRISLILFIGISIYLLISAIVVIFLTKPDKEVEVPGVIGKQFIEVYDSLTRKGIIPEIELYDVYDIDNGIILNQHPEKGEIIAEGEKIKLTISRSKVYIPVPNLIGLKVPFAKNKLSNIHLNEKTYSIEIGMISYIPSAEIPENIILDHIPEAREEISPDRKINLLVSSGNTEEKSIMPDVKGQSIDLCFDLLLAKKLSVYQEIIIADSAKKNGIIESQEPAPGEQISEGKPVKLKILYFPSKENMYTSYERVKYKIPSREKAGLYEAYIDDNKSKRISFSYVMKPESYIDFVFKRRGNAIVTIINNKEVLDTIKFKPDEFD
jgi:beta-lactam-binding protein with PASTA domain